VQYFNFNKLVDYFNMLEATLIFLGVVFVVYVLASLYYWTTQDLRLRQPDAPKNDEDLT